MVEQETRIYLIRHGSIDNPGDIAYGRLPVELSKKGEEEVRELARILKSQGIHFDHIYSSPLLRAMQTVRILADELGVSSIEVREELNDVEIGKLQGAPMQIVRDANYEEEKLREMGLGFEIESKADMVARISKLIEEVINTRPGQIVGMVSHGDVLRLALWSVQSPEKNPPGNLRDENYLAVAEAAVLIFDAQRYVGAEFVRRKSSQNEQDHTRRTEAY